MPPAAATRASRVRGECPSWEQVKERAEVSLKCRDFDRLLPIVEQIVKNGRILIYSALRRLKKAYRAFALNVLKGKTHHDIGISRQAFCNKLKKVCNCIETPVNKGQKRNTRHPKDRHFG